MTKHSKAFGEAVTRALEARGIDKLAQGEALLTVGRETLRKMKDGYVPTRVYVTTFALGLGEPVNKWLVLAGYLEPEEEGEESQDQPPVQELTREPFLGDFPVATYVEVDEAGRRRIDEIIASEAERSRLAREVSGKQSAK